MPLAEWRDTKETLHRFARSSARSGWPPARGATTGGTCRSTSPGGGSPPGRWAVDGNPIFTIDFDFVDHRLRVNTLDGRAVSFPLPGQSVAAFYRDTLAGAGRAGVRVAIAHPQAVRPARRRPAVRRGHRARRLRPGLGQPVLAGPQPGQPGAGGVRGPVLGQGQPGAPLLAHLRHRPHPLLRPPGRPAGHRRPGDPGGVLPGGDQLRVLVRRRQLSRARLLLLHRPGARRPGRRAARTRRPPGGTRATAATWPCCATTTPAPTADPRASVLDFYESAYQAGARLAGWDVERLACPGGITDPLLIRHHR